MLLLNYEHQDAATPYRSAHAIFVRDGAEDARLSPGEAPALLATRPLSVRAFSQDGMLLDGVLSAGTDAAGAFEHLLANPKAAYLHVHFATFGCYAARVDRVA